MNFGERLREMNREKYKTQLEAFNVKADPKGQRCPYCLTKGALERESDYCYHDRTRIDVSIGYMHVEYGSLYCRFCQHEIPGTHVDRVNFAERPKIIDAPSIPSELRKRPIFINAYGMK